MTFEKPILHQPFEKLLPKKSAEEVAKLRKVIKAEGCLDPLRVWTERNWLLDGYNRYDICETEGIPYEVKFIDLDDEDAAVEWIIENQLSRRNLTDEERAYFIGKQYLQKKKTHGGHAPQKEVATVATSSEKTAEIVAKENEVSARTVINDAKFADAVDKHEAKKPGSKERILKGKSGSKKKVIETAPILCDRCTKNGAARNCKWCAEEREAKKPPKKKPEAAIIPPVAVDVWDIPIQPHAEEAFAAVAKFKELSALLQSAQRLFNEVANLPGGKFLTMPDVSSYRRGKKDAEGMHADRFVHEGLERAYNQVKNATPTHTVCPWYYVDAPHPKECGACKGLNWTPVLGGNVPDSAKKRAKKELANGAA